MKNIKYLSPSSRLVCFVLLLGLGSCASISKEECLTGDWNGIGYKDGMQGKPITRVQDYIQECGKSGAVVNRPEYEKGRNEGLKIYCTKANGYTLGKAGRTMSNECPPALLMGFMKGYSAGKAVYDLERKLNDVASEMASLEKKLDDPKATPNEKAVYRNRMHDLQRDRDELNRQLTRAEDAAQRETGGPV